MAATCGRRNGLVSSSRPMRGRQRRLAGGAQLVDLLGALLQRRVLRLDGEREAGVGLRVLVAAVDHGLLGQRHQLLQRLPHHLRVALDDAAAADGEQRVADEGHAGRGDPVGDVAGGVAGRVEHAHLVRAELERVALAHLRVDAGDLGRLAARADDGALGLGLERQVAVGVVAVVVGGQDVREPPALGRRARRRPPWRRARRWRPRRRRRHRGSARRNCRRGTGTGESRAWP